MSFQDKLQETCLRRELWAVDCRDRQNAARSWMMEETPGAQYLTLGGGGVQEVRETSDWVCSRKPYARRDRTTLLRFLVEFHC